MPLSRLENLLKSGNADSLEQIVRKARDMGELVSHLRKHLPEDLAAELVAANVRESGELVVICSTSAWAARFRYETESLQAAARQLGKKVSSCTVRVQTPDGGGK